MDLVVCGVGLKGKVMGLFWGVVIEVKMTGMMNRVRRENLFCVNMITGLMEGMMGVKDFEVKERQENDKIETKPDKNGKRNLYVYDPNPNSFDFPPDSYHPPHPTYETYSYDSYGNDSHFGYDCQPQFPLNYESESGYTENYNSDPYDSSSLPQQYPCCTRCGGSHETCQCGQLIFDEPYYEMKRLSNSEYHDEIKIAELNENFNGMSIEIRKKEKLQQLEQWANLSTSP
nr:hypothetical protein [Tanacetum cinerariifolium]